jgi:hypothetical protein
MAGSDGKLRVGFVNNGRVHYADAQLLCRASENPADINGPIYKYCPALGGGAIGGVKGSCTCTCPGDNPNCLTDRYCSVASSASSDNGLTGDGKFYCINGGTVGGVMKMDGSGHSCTCTNCNAGTGYSKPRLEFAYSNYGIKFQVTVEL